MTPKPTVKILGRNWNIYRTPLNAAMGHLFVGMCDRSDQTLNVVDCHPEHMDTIFLHELLHAILEDQQVSLEESQISIIAAGLYATFRDNGWITHFFDWKKAIPMYLGRTDSGKGDKICKATQWEKMQNLPESGVPPKRGSKRSKRSST